MATLALEPFALSLARPLSTAAGTIDDRRGFLVRFTATDGTGVGEATPLPGWTESHTACEAALADAASTVRSDGVDAALHGLDGHPAARHGLALAALDARARVDDEPLYRTLGAPDRVDRVPVNATVGDGDAAATAAAATEAVASGFPAVKVKVGARSVTADVERLQRVRERCPDVELRADANGAWDRETAEEALSRFATAGVSLLEQPLPAEDLAGSAALAGGPVAVALDESLARAPVETVLDRGDPDAIVCKPMVLGGPDRARAVGRLARDRGVDAMVTTTIDAAPARAAAVHVAAALPDRPACGLATADRLAADLAVDPAPVENGAVVVPQGKGNMGSVPPPEDA